MQGDEHVFAFLDDVYVVAKPERISSIYAMLEECLRDMAGIHLHQGKTRCWNRAGENPAGLERLGPE
eukprot:4865127-Karenia_brevis.AAC.1